MTVPRIRSIPLRASVLLCASSCLLAASPAEAQGGRKVGRTSDTTGVTAQDWDLTPAGKVIRVGEMPEGCLLSPDGKWLAVVNCGQGTQSVMLVNTATAVVARIERIPRPRAVFHGLAFSGDGSTLFVSGGPSDVILAYRVPDLEPADPPQAALRANPTRPPTENPERFAGQITMPEPTRAGVCLYPIGLALAPDSKTLWVAEALGDAVAIVDPTAGTVVQRIPVGTYPYEIAFTPDGAKAYVTLWGEARVAVVDVASRRAKAQINVGAHPCAVCVARDGSRVYVANAHSDTVSIIDTGADAVVGTISLAPYPHAPLGTMPNALCLSADGGTLYVADAGNNAVDVVRLNGARTDGRTTGRIPTGWYPTGVQVAPNGRLWVTSAKGVGSGQNAYPQRRYIGQCMDGICQMIPAPTAAQLAAYDAQVNANTYAFPGGVVRRPASTSAQTPIPRRLGAPSPIKYCIYVIKENRTYDQVFGDLPQGNGDAKLVMFGRDLTPNQHALAERYVLLDNFYCDGWVSVDGHQWCKGANVSDAIEKTWSFSYSRRGPTIGGPVGTPSGGWLWERAAQAGVSCKVYGSTLAAGADLKAVATVLGDVRQAERTGEMPHLIIMHLPNNHTFGTARGRPSPKALVAENDLAVGRLIEGLSGTKFWPQIAVFIIEDDAQDGPDHVECHRSPALVVGPWIKRGVVDSSFYDQCAVVRTMELILGLRPLSQFDAAAMPMFALFMDRPNLEGYRAITPRQSLTEMNVAGAYGQEECTAMNFDEVDEAPWPELNRILWHAMKGADTPLPQIKYARFAMSVSPRGDD